MALIKSPLRSDSARGGVARSFCFSEKRGVQYAQKSFLHGDRKSPAQKKIRTEYKEFYSFWNSLPWYWRREWNDAARGYPYSGYNLFMRDAFQRRARGLPLVSYPPYLPPGTYFYDDFTQPDGAPARWEAKPLQWFVAAAKYHVQFLNPPVFGSSPLRTPPTEAFGHFYELDFSCLNIAGGSNALEMRFDWMGPDIQIYLSYLPSEGRINLGARPSGAPVDLALYILPAPFNRDAFLTFRFNVDTRKGQGFHDDRLVLQADYDMFPAGGYVRPRLAFRGLSCVYDDVIIKGKKRSG